MSSPPASKRQRLAAEVSKDDDDESLSNDERSDDEDFKEAEEILGDMLRDLVQRSLERSDDEDLKEAKEILDEMLRDLAQRSQSLSMEANLELCHESLELMRMYPALASSYCACLGESKVYPLTILSGSSFATLDTVKEIHELYPQAILELQEWSDLFPLGNACLENGNEDIIEFLAKKNKDALLKDVGLNGNPFSILLYNDHSLHLIKTLLELRPDLIQNAACLGYAFAGSSYEVFEYLVDKSIESGVEHLNFEVEWNVPEDHIRYVRKMVEILPNIKKFRCMVKKTMSIEAWEIMLECFIRSKRIAEFDFNVLVNWSDECHSFLAKKLQALLTTITTLESLQISFDWDDAEEEEEEEKRTDHDIDRLAYLQVLFDLRERLPATLHSMTLNGLQGVAESTIIGLATQSNTNTVHLADLLIRDADDDDEQGPYMLDGNPSTDIKNVIIAFDSLKANSNTWDRLVVNLATIPNLSKLAMRGERYSGINIKSSAGLKAILAHDNLTHLTLTNHRPLFPEKEISEALKNNTALITFDFPQYLRTKKGRCCMAKALSENVTKLVNVAFRPETTFEEEECPMVDRIQYYAFLNRYGRTETRQQSTSLSSFVELLVSVVDALELEDVEDLDEYEFDDDISMFTVEGLLLTSRLRPLRLNMLHGLLRERPGLWCNL